MAIIYIRRAGDDKEIKAYYDSFIKLSDEELVNEYNQRQKKGIIGSHYQAIYLIAMDRAFKEKFNKSQYIMIIIWLLTLRYPLN